VNFVSSITLQFRDAFSSGFSSAKNSFAGMKGALDDINQNQSMNRLAADLAMASSLTEPFRQKLSAMMDLPSQLAGEFDSSMRNIQSLTNESNESLKDLQKELLAVGSGAVAGPQAIADAYYNIASGIGKAEVRMDTLRAATALAEAGQANLGAATSGLISVVNAYNTPAENMTNLSDVFFQTVKKGVGSLDGFVGAMSSISGLSASVGIGFDELGSSMAFLTAKGQTESVAATQLKAAMVSLLRPNEDLSKALQSIGISSGSAMLEQYGLAESLSMVKAAVGGSQDNMAKALGSVEALQAAITLTADDYTSFAQSYSSGLSGATAEALDAQTQSYESKVARLQSASDALKIQMGDDINNIKGLFVDMGAGFLNNVVAPIMSSPVGEVFQGIAAGVGLAAQGVLSLGSGALNAATQLVVMTATLQNAGGFAKLFGSSLSLMTQPFKLIGGFALKAIGPIIAFGASLWTALAPILPIVAVVAALAIGGYLLVKNWDAVSAFFVNLWGKITGAFKNAFDWIKGIFSGVPNWIKGALAVMFPFISIPILIIKNWNVIAGFFAGLWANVVQVFTTAWTYISAFFTSVWNGIVSVVLTVANWFGSVWGVVTGAFAAAWTWVSDLFTSIWEGIKGVVLGFVSWLQPVIDVIIAPFKAIGTVVGGILDTIGGWFGDTASTGTSAVAQINSTLAKDTGAKVATAAPVAGAATAAQVAAPSLATTTSAIAAPELGASSSQINVGTSSSGKSSLLAEHMAAASRKGIAGSEISTAASDAFMSVGSAISPSADFADISADARTSFQEAMPTQQSALATPWTQGETKTEKSTRTIKIENLYLQADDCLDVFNFVRQLELAVSEPAEVV
jgi:TP901 family phage tail tape measure protein